MTLFRHSLFVCETHKPSKTSKVSEVEAIQEPLTDVSGDVTLILTGYSRTAQATGSVRFNQASSRAIHVPMCFADHTYVNLSLLTVMLQLIDEQSQ